MQELNERQAKIVILHNIIEYLEKSLPKAIDSGLKDNQFTENEARLLHKKRQEQIETFRENIKFYSK